MQTTNAFKNLEQELLPMKFDRAEFYGILNFWREYDPNRVEELMSKGILRKTLKQIADALWETQQALEKSELLPPALARMEAWKRLMRIADNDNDDDEQKEMPLEEYLARL